jgi:hypothetical protein
MKHEGAVRDELLNWLRMLAWAGVAVAIVGALFAIAPAVTELIAQR